MAKAGMANILCAATISIACSATAAPSASAPVNKAHENQSASVSQQQHSEKSNSSEKGSTSKIKSAKDLGKLIVHGHKLSPICTLEVLKLALKRSISTNAADSDALICRVFTLTGTHIKSRAHLWCRRNSEILKHRGGIYNVALLDAKLPTVDRGKLRAILNKLPDKLSRTCFEPK